jgi:hypothetical protein
MLTQLAIACGIIVACAVLNRVRGGGFWGDKLPGRALLWVAPAMGLVAWAVNPWPVAVAFGLGYLAWGVLAWSYILCRLAGIEPPRSPGIGEAFCMLAPGKVAPVFVRMMFVLPCVVAVAWLLGNWWFLAAALAFAAAATAVYALLFRPIGSHDWMRAEIATGAVWGLLILSATL